MKRIRLLSIAVLAALTGSFAAPCSYAEVSQLDEVVVEAERYRRSGNESVVVPLGVVADQVQSVGLLGNKDALETPYSSMTLTHKDLEYFGSPEKGVTDMLTLNPSVRDSSSSLYNDIAIRGFRINGHQMYINGIPGLLDQQRSNDIFVDKATVISGPNLGITGTPISNAVGGTVDFQSKRAHEKGNFDLTLSYQGGESFREIVDIGRRFGDDQRWGVRVMADNMDGDTAIKGENIKQRDFFVNIDQKTTQSKSNLLVGYNYVNQHGSPYSFSFDTHLSRLPKAPEAGRTYKPEWSYNEYDNWIVAFNHEQKLSDHVTAFVNAGYHREDWFGYIDGTPRILNENGDFSISLTNYPLALTKKYLGIGIKGQFELGSTKHEYLVNVDKNWYNYWLSQEKSFGTGGVYKVTGNIYQDNSWLSPIITHGRPAKYMDERITGWHVTDTISMLDDRLSFMLGVHGHKVTESRVNQQERSYDAVCPTYAVNYKITPEFSIYASHSETFNSGTMVSTTMGYANAGELLDPNKAKQNEFGFKYKGSRLLHTLSFYALKQANYNVETINGLKYYREYGEQDDKGIEYSIAGAIGKKLDIIGGVAYMNAKQALTGKPVNGAAKWSATLGMVYRPNESWNVIGRAQYMGTAPIMNEKLTVPSHVVFDFGAVYDTKIHETPVTLQAMLYNAFNKNYWLAVSSNSDAVRLGSPRTIVLSATMHL